MVQEKTTTVEMEVQLTHVQLAEVGKMAGDLKKEADKVEAAFDVVRQEYKANMKDLTSKLSSLLTTLESGKEKREVEVLERRDYNSCLFQHVYEGKVVFERALTQEEMQQDMFNGNPYEKKAEEEEQQALPLGEQVAMDIKESTNPYTASSAVN